ncbi:MAG: S-layer protein domain-containing protein [Candidatus Methanoperedens sp.]|nr:S-layer protein domain-containing protein [Candidatus Methanoperedens sp.]MCZ7371168.1 S-layer protein domain-containing protein [Candidatus Methanoperedens sp.]
MIKKLDIAVIAASAILIAMLTSMHASANIQAYSVEIRGAVVSVPGSLSDTTPRYWDASNFAGFWYDLKNNLMTENLSVVSVQNRNIDGANENLIYTTTKTFKTLKVVENGKINGTDSDMMMFNSSGTGKYSILGWQAQPYIPVKGNAKKLAKLVIEQGNATTEKKTLEVGETWDIGDGWNLTAASINASTLRARLVLNKDGINVSDKIIAQGGIYIYNQSLANETNVPMFLTYVDSVSPGSTGDMVQLRYTWAISTSVTEVKSSDVFGKMVLTSAGSDTLVLKNKDKSVDLTQDGTIDIMGDLKFRVADSATDLRYYPMVVRTQPGTYEVRGLVISVPGSLSDPTPRYWDASNFAGFWYDLKNDLKTENLWVLSVQNRNIDGANENLIYTTTKTFKTLKVVENGKLNATDSDMLKINASGTGQYPIIGWQAQPYIPIKSNAKKLAKLIIEQGNATNEKKSLTVGETWDIGDGWTLLAQSVDAKASPRQVWLVLSKDGVKKDDKVIQQGGVYTYIEKSFAGETDVPLFITYVDSVFAGATSDMVQLRYTWAIGTSVTEVKSSDVFGNMEVVAAGTDTLVLKNKDKSVDLTQDGTVDIMGELKFRVADSATDLRYYPFVTYEILTPPPPPRPFDTLNFVGNTWNLVSVPKTLNNSAVDVAFANLSLDPFNIKWYYNTSTNAWENPSKITPLRGYWVYNNASNQSYQKLSYKNMAGPNVPPSMLLRAGWNLIGHTSTGNMPVQSALISIDGKYSHLLTYSPDEGWKMYIVGNPSLQEFNVFEPGRGYWIFMTQDATYAAVDI